MRADVQAPMPKLRPPPISDNARTPRPRDHTAARKQPHNWPSPCNAAQSNSAAPPPAVRQNWATAGSRRLLQRRAERARIPGAGIAVAIRVNAQTVAVRPAFGQKRLLRQIGRADIWHRPTPPALPKTQTACATARPAHGWSPAHIPQYSARYHPVFAARPPAAPPDIARGSAQCVPHRFEWSAAPSRPQNPARPKCPRSTPALRRSPPECPQAHCHVAGPGRLTRSQRPAAAMTATGAMARPSAASIAAPTAAVENPVVGATATGPPPAKDASRLCE